MASEIEAVLHHVFDGGKLSESPSGADESTLRRWLKEFSRKMPEWAGSVEARAFELYNRALSFIHLPSHPLRRLERILSELPALPSRWTVMVKTLWWLKTSHPL